MHDGVDFAFDKKLVEKGGIGDIPDYHVSGGWNRT